MELMEKRMLKFIKCCIRYGISWENFQKTSPIQILRIWDKITH